MIGQNGGSFDAGSDTLVHLTSPQTLMCKQVKIQHFALTLIEIPWRIIETSLMGSELDLTLL